MSVVEQAVDGGVGDGLGYQLVKAGRVRFDENATLRSSYAASTTR